MHQRLTTGLLFGSLALLTSLALSGCFLLPEDDPASYPDNSFTVGSVTFPDDSATSRALLTTAANGRVSAFLEKCKTGKSVTLGFIGGSISAGARLNHSKRYSSVLAAFLRHDYPGLNVNIVNSSISATGSRYATSRARFQLFPKKPDFVVLEFAVNDVGTASDEEIKASLEGLVRQSLKLGVDVPVLLLFTMKGDGYNIQDVHSVVGRHYELPMISYRDAVWPLRTAERVSWEDLFVDDPHPSIGGHRIIAQLIHTYLKRAAPQTGGTGVYLPAPLLTDLFERAGIHAPKDTAVVSAGSSWKRTANGPDDFGPVRYQYRSAGKGIDTLTLQTRSREITIGMHMQPKDTSSIRIYVDGVFHSSHNNYYAFDHTRIVRLPIAPTSGPRTFQVIQSGSNSFTLDYVLYAGTPD